MATATGEKAGSRSRRRERKTVEMTGRGSRVAQHQEALSGLVQVHNEHPRFFTAAKRAAFFAAFEESYHIGNSCAIAGVKRGTIRYWRQHNLEFRERIEAIIAEGCLDLKARMLAMAIHGVRSETLTTQIDGERVRTETRSDNVKLGLSLLYRNDQAAAAQEAVRTIALEQDSQPSADMLVEWMRADVEAAHLALANAGGEQESGAGGDG
jgi:hypothetical protein